MQNGTQASANLNDNSRDAIGLVQGCLSVMFTTDRLKTPTMAMVR